MKVIPRSCFPEGRTWKARKRKIGTIEEGGRRTIGEDEKGRGGKKGEDEERRGREAREEEGNLLFVLKDVVFIRIK